MGDLEAIYACSWAVSGRRKAETRQMSKSFEHLGKISILGLSLPSWRPSWRHRAVLGQLRANFGHLGGFLARLTPSGAVLGASLNRLGAFLGRFIAVLEAILGVLEASWAVLGPSWGRLGGLLGRHGAILEASWAILEASWAIAPDLSCGRAPPRCCHLGQAFAWSFFSTRAQRQRLRQHRRASDTCTPPPVP